MNKERRRILFQVALFVTTFFTTTLAGAEWAYGKVIWSGNYTWNDFALGLEFSIPLLLILTVHEFGHYFVAMYHKVKTSLPYYIPIPPIPFLPFSLGTMGAVIRLRSRPASNIQTFDIGLAGPLAGFIVALVILFYGFKTLPPPEYIYQFHPEYEQYGASYKDIVYTEEFMKAHQPMIDIKIGTNLIFWIFGKVAGDPDRIPNAHEIMHYPVLLATYIALFVTCLNLLPIGQLDGGHVIYGMFGFKVHRVVATASFLLLIFYAGLGIDFISPKQPFGELMIGILGYLAFLFIAFTGLKQSVRDTIMYVLIMFALQFSISVFFPGIRGYEGWLLFGLILGRFIGIQHPASEIEVPLDPNRIMLGWITLLVFVLCFSPAPIELTAFIDQ